MAGFHHTIHLSIHPTASLSFVPSLWLISVPFFLIPSFVWTSVLSLISSFPAWHHHPSIYPFLTSFPPSGMLLSCDKSVQMNWVKKKKKTKKTQKRKNRTDWSIWDALNDIQSWIFCLEPGGLYHNTSGKYTANTVHYAHCRHTLPSWNIFQPNSCLLDFKACRRPCFVVFASWRTTPHRHKECILALSFLAVLYNSRLGSMGSGPWPFLLHLREMLATGMLENV